MNCVFLVHIVFFPRINIFFTFFICFCFFVLLFNIFYAPSYFLICPSILFSKWPNKIISQLITFPPAFLSPSSSLGFHVDSCFPDTLHDSHHGFPFLCPCVGSPVSQETHSVFTPSLCWGICSCTSGRLFMIRYDNYMIYICIWYDIII